MMSDLSMTSPDKSKNIPITKMDLSVELPRKRKRSDLSEKCQDFSYEEVNDMSVESLVRKARLAYVDKSLNMERECLWLDAFIRLLDRKRDTIKFLIAEELKGKYTKKKDIDIEIIVHDYWSRLHKEKLK